MCLILIAVNPDSNLRLVLGANRDEAHDRPTQTAHRWQSSPAMLAGRDLEAGGTWLGATATGRVAAVTNYREGPSQPASTSRGALVTDFLQSDAGAEQFIEALQKRATDYSGFNLLVHDGESTWCTSNRGPTVALQTGFHGLSNHLINTPWPKVTRTLGRFQTHYAEAHQVMRVLSDTTPAADDALPQTGLPLDLERKVSPAFIVSETYGTRCSTWLSVSKDGVVQFHEKSFDPTGKESAAVTLTEP